MFFVSDSKCALTDSLTGTAATTTTAGLDTVLLEVGEIGVTGAGEQVHCAATVVLGALVLVADHHANRCTQSNTELCTGLDLDSVLLIPRGSQGTLAGTATGHLRLNITLGELHARGTSIDDTADGTAVRLAIAALGIVLVGGWKNSSRGNIRGDAEMLSPRRHDDYDMEVGKGSIAREEEKRRAK